MIGVEEKKKLLRKHTNLTEREIQKHLKDGVFFYPNNNDGYKAFFDECIAGLFDEEDISEMWEVMNIVGDYRGRFYPIKKGK